MDYRDQQMADDSCDIASVNGLTSDVVIYHRTTSRIGDAVLTFMEDGTINIKRGKDTLTTTAEEMYHICGLSQSLRDHKKEVGTARLIKLNSNAEKQAEYYRLERESITTEHGV